VIIAQKKQNKKVGSTNLEELKVQEVITIGYINRMDHRKTRRIALQLKTIGDMHIWKTSEDQDLSSSSTTRRTQEEDGTLILKEH
jgi:hypothetical protein